MKHPLPNMGKTPKSSFLEQLLESEILITFSGSGSDVRFTVSHHLTQAVSSAT